MNLVTITLHNEDTILPKDRRELLTYKMPFLVPCTLHEEDEEAELCFDIEGLSSCKEMEYFSLADKYRFLLNVASLAKYTDRYYISLSPENIYMDINLMPKVLMRDISSTDSNAFLREYKALIASVLFPKYCFEDYAYGGDDLYHKKRKIKEVCTLNSLEELEKKLLSLYMKELDDTHRFTTTIKKRRLLAYHILLPLLVILSIGCVLLTGQMYLYELPFDKQLIQGNNAYLSGDYISTQELLSDIELNKLPYESKYILARSYVVTEGLNSLQKENVLSMLMPQTDSIYFDYWINLGRLDFEKAIDCAQRIFDDQLLILAYMKYESFLRTDTVSYTGDEKASKISDLQNKIENLTKEINEKREEILQE